MDLIKKAGRHLKITIFKQMLQEVVDLVRRAYFIYELNTGILILDPWERYLFTGTVVITLLVIVLKILY